MMFKSIPIMFYCIFSVTIVNGQVTGSKQFLDELNFVLRIETNDGSQLEITEFGGVLDTENTNETYQYNLGDINIEEPYKDGNQFVIDLTCSTIPKCILFNRRRDIPLKDFLVRSEKAAETIYLKLVQLKDSFQ